MPRGNPEFGRQVKSPGRPKKPKIEDASSTKAYVDAFIDAHLPEYLKTLHEAATGRSTKDVKVKINAANLLIERRLGRPIERRESDNDNLIAMVRELAALVPKPASVQVVEATVKELPPGECGTAAGEVSNDGTAQGVDGEGRV